jgi:acetyl-CoA carboxylase biotin carboxylase subunit
VIIKAAAGGGGRGMRVVESISELESAYVACQREAGAYFDNPAVFVERYIANPRHIEIQVLCDGKNGISLFERDCSIQRRHQKLLEEAPSYFLNQDQRRHLGEIAVRAALAVGYQGAGTVEFICESPEQAYFMEMNTRIQVEHPVTEMITGVDLIAEQIRIAQGLGLRWHQDQLQVNGWAIEARINAEDPVQGFIPRPGKIEQIHLPQGPGIRVDTHIYPGYEIPSEYDSMIAKLIVWAPSRDEAIARLRRALQELEIKGVPTTAKFHQALLQDEDFQKGIFSTRFMENKSEDLLRSMTKTPIENNHIPQLVAAFLAQKSQVKVNLTENSQRKSWEEVGRLENQHRL